MANSNRNRHRDSSYYPENNRGNDKRNQRNRQEQDNIEWQGGRGNWDDESHLYMGNSANEQYNAARESYNNLPGEERYRSQQRNSDYDTNSGRYNQRNNTYRSRGYEEFAARPEDSEYSQEDRYNEQGGYNPDRFNEQQHYNDRRGARHNKQRPGDYGRDYEQYPQRGWDDMRGAGEGKPGLGNDHRGKGPKGYKRSDGRIHEDINDRLSDDSRLDASEIEVQVLDGEVILMGTVSDRASKRRAEDLVEAISGVTNVENRIRVKQQNGSGDSDTKTDNGSNKTRSRK